MYNFVLLGLNVTIDIIAKELIELWEPGITVNGITYRVALLNGIWDGRGFEQITKTQGAGSLAGCNACNFEGVRFAGTCVYPNYSRYLLPNDPRRLRRPLNVPNADLMYNLSTEILAPPVDRTYASYLSNAQSLSENIALDHVNGVKGIWSLDILPYASHIWKTKVLLLK